MKEHDQKEWDDLVYANMVLSHENFMLKSQLKDETNEKNRFQDLFRDSRVIKTFAIAASFTVTLILTMLVFGCIDPGATWNTKIGVICVSWCLALGTYYIARQIEYKIKGL